MIIHGPREKRDFTVLPNRILRDEALSYRARGLLCFLLSQPPDWEISSTRLTLEFGEGRDAVRSAIRELVNTGYMQLQKVQGHAGRWSTHYIVTGDPWWFENPVDSPVDNSVTGA